MMIFREIFLILLLAWAPNVYAESLVSMYLLLSDGQRCGYIPDEELKLVGATCPSRNGTKIKGSVWNSIIFEQAVYQKTAEKQIEKNKCLTEMIDLLDKDPEKMGIWYQRLLRAWLGLKKSELILNICSREVLSRLEPANIARYGGLKGALDEANRDKTILQVKERRCLIFS
ncbi:MAG: hypothetical protein JNM39_13330 [Bdellovibrionaceae bacterium]|nr:hypothetical protein [Pseudobdellovibrionaceae bacterium]